MILPALGWGKFEPSDDLLALGWGKFGSIQTLERHYLNTSLSKFKNI
jgi:hypothetical protein